MSAYKILPSQVLIVPGYTNDEILALSAKTQNSSKAAQKNATKSEDKTKSSKKTKSEDKTKKTATDKAKAKTGKSKKSTTTTKKKDKKNQAKKNTAKTTTTKKTSTVKTKKNKVTESSAATGTAATTKIDKPKALLFSPESVDYTPHRKDYEEFNSADGLILIEKACDVFAELQLSLSVHQAMRIQENGTIELSKDDKRPIDIITEGAPTIWDKETDLGHFIDPSEFTDSYIEIRRGFFDRYIGRPLTLVSDLFPTIPVCYITDLSYTIDEGEEPAKYSITFKEVDNTWG